MPALTERANRTVVRSPLAGRVDRVLVTKVGGSLSPGAPLVDIVPSDENLLIEDRRTSPSFITASARKSVSSPIIRGFTAALGAEAIAISPDAVCGEQTGENF